MKHTNCEENPVGRKRFDWDKVGSYYVKWVTVQGDSDLRIQR